MNAGQEEVSVPKREENNNENSQYYDCEFCGGDGCDMCNEGKRKVPGLPEPPPQPEPKTYTRIRVWMPRS
jgi:hypothetical protein